MSYTATNHQGAIKSFGRELKQIIKKTSIVLLLLWSKLYHGLTKTLTHSRPSAPGRTCPCRALSTTFIHSDTSPSRWESNAAPSWCHIHTHWPNVACGCLCCITAKNSHADAVVQLMSSCVLQPIIASSHSLLHHIWKFCSVWNSRPTCVWSIVTL